MPDDVKFIRASLKNAMQALDDREDYMIRVYAQMAADKATEALAAEKETARPR